jgi:hypothetical protein
VENLELYNAVREVPKEAQKAIGAGRLKGMTDINPMWRIKVLTEQFGICGLGWYTEIIKTWLETGANGEITANVEIRLYIKKGNDWSRPIQGIGGSKFVAKETNGLYTDDECYKKAYTDAVSVACKALGIGADVYFAKDSTKYDGAPKEAASAAQKPNQTAEPVRKADEFKRLTKSELVQVYGVKNAEATLAALEKKLGVAFKDWDAETTEKVRETLEKMKKKNTEEMEKYRNEPDDDLPF